MPPSNLCLLLATVVTCLLALAGRMHAQGIRFQAPKSANLSTSWTISLRADDSHRLPSLTYVDGTSARVFLQQSIEDPPQDLSFAACFYCTTPCTAFLFGICIVFTDYEGYSSPIDGPSLQVVWSANRGRLVRENATLSFTTTGNLVLRDIDGGLIWSTDTSEVFVAGMNLTRSGNLVLFNHKNMPVWQSFDHPTDTLVPGQPLVEGMRLTPNASATNWTISNQFYVTVRADATNLTSAQDMSYIRLESDGHLRLYQFGLVGWQMVQDILEGQVDDCAYPTVCGEYGVWMSGQCTCPMDGNATYFKQIDDHRTNLGCTPVTPISCASMPDHQLVPLSNISYFNYIDRKAALPQLIDEESCKKACLSNCSCKAALFQYGGNDTSKGSCYLPTQLFSLQIDCNKRPQMSVVVKVLKA
ncbi:hypothetical protein PR202_ga24112 [Eleusine coracana subsp. coracana]|uniref:non-specific serine/threonine protein kinase n=1 Tax=Eleusine coracana subsp. coracana TaxID=191504 RepID=A0AAV5D7N7_ELECO|nr:hypothetical protein PR202_ga24112 [Eleusine coracana subsp. coracana]